MQPDDNNDNENSSCPNSSALSVLSENDPGIPSNDISDDPISASSGLSMKVGDCVIVKYDVNFYPRVVTRMKMPGAEVTVIVASGTNYISYIHSNKEMVAASVLTYVQCVGEQCLANVQTDH